MASEIKEEQNSKLDICVDENAADESSQECDSSTKDGKIESKEDSVKVESDEEDEDDEEVGLLDRPVEVTGCRARKKVERLEMSFATPKEKQEFVEGKGVKLGECPRIDMQIQKIKVPELKPLHKILFNRTGSANEIKKNIRKFSGFPFEQDSPEYVRKKGVLEKMTIAVLKQVCSTLDLERGGTKEDLSKRIMSFLLMPEDSGKEVPKKKPAKEKKKSTGGKTVKKAKSAKKGKNEKTEKEEENKYEMNMDDDSTGGEASMGGTDEENETNCDEPKTKSKERKKAKPKHEKEKDEKPKAAKRKIEDSSDDSEDEQPEAKKANQMPSDEDISQLIKQILEGADLQEITMKKVIKQVSDAYPDFDLTHKKPFIKTTIKSIIKFM